MTPPDRLHGFRKAHLALLVVVLVAVVVLVLLRGVDARGALLIAVTAGLVLLRWWQFRRSRPRGD